MRISDWSSDVCSSDLLAPLVRLRDEQTETLLGYETIVDLSVQREDEAERVIREAEEDQRQRSTAEQLTADAETRRGQIEADPTLLEKADEIDPTLADRSHAPGREACRERVGPA